MEALSQDSNYSRGPVPLAARPEGRDSLTFVMLGFNVFPASMWTGGTLGTGLLYNDFFSSQFSSVNLPPSVSTLHFGYIGAKPTSTHLLLHVTLWR